MKKKVRQSKLQRLFNRYKEINIFYRTVREAQSYSARTNEVEVFPEGVFIQSEFIPFSNILVISFK